MWVRGLKPCTAGDGLGVLGSHPMWVRGLKLGRLKNTNIVHMSHPMWVRGLKHHLYLTMIRSSRRTLCGCVD